MDGGRTGRAGGKSWKAVHLMSAEEVTSLFGGIVEGLGFLVGGLSYSSFLFVLLRLLRLIPL